MNTEIIPTLEKMGLTMECQFVPFSQSRNKAEKYPSLNWIVTLKHNGREVLTTDYMAGCAHCPSYKQNANFESKKQTEYECEYGIKAGRWSDGISRVMPNSRGGQMIKPKLEDVIYSLVMDSDVLEYDFAEWCANFGMDEDSRKAEKMYKDCQQIALKMVRALGTDGLKTLREVYQDY